MNILVCVKQVPDTTVIKIDPVKHTLIREGVPSILNTFDAYALETALRVRESAGGKITVLSMGPEQAKEVLKECISVGADAAYLVSDRAFGGSDTLATSRTLAEAIRVLEEQQGEAFDLIFCGKQAIDGDTAQVGPEIAEHLGMPQVTYALEVQEAGADGLKVIREAEDGKQVVGVSYPCLVTFTKPNFDPRFPTIKRKMAARKAVIEQITAADLEGIDLSRAGLKGSPTKVKRTYVPPRKKSGVMITGETPEECAAKLYEALNSAHII